MNELELYAPQHKHACILISQLLQIGEASLSEDLHRLDPWSTIISSPNIYGSLQFDTLDLEVSLTCNRQREKTFPMNGGVPVSSGNKAGDAPHSKRRLSDGMAPYIVTFRMFANNDWTEKHSASTDSTTAKKAKKASASDGTSLSNKTKSGRFKRTSLYPSAFDLNLVCPAN